MLRSDVIFQNMTAYCMVNFCGRTMTITRTLNTTKDFFYVIFFSEPKCGLLLSRNIRHLTSIQISVFYLPEDMAERKQTSK